MLTKVMAIILEIPTDLKKPLRFKIKVAVKCGKIDDFGTFGSSANGQF
jgi:hypothetical protein